MRKRIQLTLGKTQRKDVLVIAWGPWNQVRNNAHRAHRGEELSFRRKTKGGEASSVRPPAFSFQRSKAQGEVPSSRGVEEAGLKLGVYPCARARLLLFRFQRNSDAFIPPLGMMMGRGLP